MRKLSKRLLVAAGITAAVALTNKFIFAAATLKDHLHNNRARFYQWKFGKVFYTVQGNGPAILLVHDTTAGSSAYEFNRIVNTLAKHYRVYTMDLLGYGRSDKPMLTYTAYMYTQLMVDFTKDVIRSTTSVVTSGKSNAYAAMACYQEPNRFHNLIFINPEDLKNLNRNPKRQHQVTKFLIELPVIGTAFYNLLHSRAMTSRNLNAKFYKPKTIRDRFGHAVYESAHLGGSASRFVYASDLCRYNNVNITDALASINNSIYIIHGRQSTKQTDLCNDYKEINPAIECAVIDRSGDFPHMEKPESVLEALSLYLR